VLIEIARASDVEKMEGVPAEEGVEKRSEGSEQRRLVEERENRGGGIE